MQTTFSSPTEWEVISINFQIPVSWSELSDSSRSALLAKNQLRKVYELIASDYDADDKSFSHVSPTVCHTWLDGRCKRLFEN